MFRKSKRKTKRDIKKENYWEEVIDFTKVKKGGVNIEEILRCL